LPPQQPPGQQQAPGAQQPAAGVPFAEPQQAEGGSQHRRPAAQQSLPASAVALAQQAPPGQQSCGGLQQSAADAGVPEPPNTPAHAVPANERRTASASPIKSLVRILVNLPDLSCGIIPVKGTTVAV
jgi:hypothetical protein